MLLSKQETIERICKMAENNINEREEKGATGDNPDYITLYNALIYLR